MYQKIIRRIIIHHTWSIDHPDILDWEGIRQYHLSLGWDDIGYHYGIEKTAEGLIILRGRPDYIQGTHCFGVNHNSLGIAVVGNFDIAPPEDAIISRLAGLCVMLKHKHPGITAIEPHNKYSTKTCPGKMFNMDKLAQRVIEYG